MLYVNISSVMVLETVASIKYGHVVMVFNILISSKV